MDECIPHGDSSDEAVSSDDEQERFGRRLPRARYTTVDDDDNDDDDDDKDYRPRRNKRSRDEAIYGVFMEGEDSEDEGFRKRRRKKAFFKETSSSSTKTAPLFVKGDVLQDDDIEEEKVPVPDTTTPQVDDATIKQSSNKDQSAAFESSSEPPPPPSEEDLAMQKQREEANNKFLALLDRAKRKGTRPVLPRDEEESKETAWKDKPKAPVLGMQNSSVQESTSTPDLSASASAAAMPALGLGMTSAAAPPTKKDPNLGTWERHTKGIGMKLLAKMGYKGSGGLGSKRRLAEQKTGISRALEVKVRPANLGLGYGGFREASTLKVNRQLEAQVRGEAVPEKDSTKPSGDATTTTTTYDRSSLPTVDELLKDSAWQKGAREVKTKKEKQKRTVIPYNQLLEAKSKEQEPMKIVDLRGPQLANMATASDEAVEGAANIAPPALGEELLHNVSLLLSTYESKLHSHSQFASAAEQKLNSLQTEVDELERQQKIVQERREKMEKAAAILEAYEAQFEKGSVRTTDKTQLDAAVEMVQELSHVFSAEDRKSLKFDRTLAPVLLGDALENTLKRWNPLRKSANEEDSIRLVKSIIHLQLRMEEQSSSLLKRSLFLKYLLPKIQKSYESAHWDVKEQVEVGLRFFENLLDLVREGFGPSTQDDESDDAQPTGAKDITDKVRHAIIFEAIHPKLERALSSWKPSLSAESQLVNPPHEWILPWVPFLDHPGILPTLMAQCKRRVESAVSFLARKISDDDEAFLEAFVSALRPWARAFKSSSVHDLTSKYASERLAASLRKASQSVAAIQRTFDMHQGGLLSSIDFLALLECDLLHCCVVPFYEQASSAKANASKLAEFYLKEKRRVDSLAMLFPTSRKTLRSDEIIARCFLCALRMIEAVGKTETKVLARLEPPSHSLAYTAIRSRRIRDRKRNAQAEMLRMESGNKDKLATQTRARFIRQDNNDKATFREVVEDFCLQESIPFVPRTTGARTHVDGKQVFLFGRIPIYLDSDVVFVHEGQDRWEPISLESLVERARAEV